MYELIYEYWYDTYALYDLTEVRGEYLIDLLLDTCNQIYLLI